jgi:hypothetical protein
MPPASRAPGTRHAAPFMPDNGHRRWGGLTGHSHGYALAGGTLTPPPRLCGCPPDAQSRREILIRADGADGRFTMTALPAWGAEVVLSCATVKWQPGCVAFLRARRQLLRFQPCKPGQQVAEPAQAWRQGTLHWDAVSEAYRQAPLAVQRCWS